MSTARATIVIERTFAARVEELWDLWTTKEGFESWWGPEGFRVEVRALEAVPGGLLDYEMIADAPEMVAAMQEMGQPVSHGVRARFSALQPHAHLAITSVIDFLPGVAAYESTIAVDFAADGAGARLTVTLEAMHTEELSRMAAQGFTSQLRKLERRFGPAPA